MRFLKMGKINIVLENLDELNKILNEVVKKLRS
nr:MAG TPA: Stage 0 sporulation protein J, DNA binding protein, bacterial [Caudoviricetes sp.]